MLARFVAVTLAVGSLESKVLIGIITVALVGSGFYYKSGDQFGAGSQSFQLFDGDGILSLYATGATVEAGSLPLKNVFGRPFSGVFR